jgi:hypothetical protein
MHGPPSQVSQDGVALSERPTAKPEKSFCTSLPPHFSHAGLAALLLFWSTSIVWPHPPHLYSKIGICRVPQSGIGGRTSGPAASARPSYLFLRLGFELLDALPYIGQRALEVLGLTTQHREILFLRKPTAGRTGVGRIPAAGSGPARHAGRQEPMPIAPAAAATPAGKAATAHGIRVAGHTMAGAKAARMSCLRPHPSGTGTIAARHTYSPFSENSTTAHYTCGLVFTTADHDHPYVLWAYAHNKFNAKSRMRQEFSSRQESLNHDPHNRTRRRTAQIMSLRARLAERGNLPTRE